MSIWSSYPLDYRSAETRAVLSAAQRGECAAVLGLSGAGKSNLLGFLAYRAESGLHRLLVDCNRLPEPSPPGFWRLLLKAVQPDQPSQPLDEWEYLESSLAAHLAAPQSKLCILLDRFDALPASIQPVVYGRLRALRDDHKYALTYVIGSRRPVDPQSELAELFYAHTIWLGPLAPADARWSAAGYASRAGQEWDDDALNCLIQFSGGYPALLRAACEAYASGCPLQTGELLVHPSVRSRLDEFWSAEPTPEELRSSRLVNLPWLVPPAAPGHTPEPAFNTARLTAKELRLWEALLAQPGKVCEKDELIRAVWPEDKVFLEGIRDDALAQLIRRLREKIEEQSGNPQWIQTIPGRGYTYQRK